MRAISAFQDKQLSDFYLFAGVALEHAMKAKLAEDNPVFLSEDKNFGSAVALWRTREDVSTLPPETRTISGRIAFQRLVDLDPAFSTYKNFVNEVLHMRNEEAHVGSNRPGNPERTLVAFLKCMHALFDLSSQEGFWREHEAFVTVSLNESAAEVEKTVTLKIALAKAAYERKMAILDTREEDMLRLGLSTRLGTRDPDTEMVTVCPACQSDCILLGESHLDWDVFTGDDGPEANPFVAFTCSGLGCSFCGLRLSGLDELDAAHVNTRDVNDQANLDEHLRAELDW